MTAADAAQDMRDALAQRVMGWTRSERQWAYSDTAAVWHAPDGTPVMTQFSWRPDENDAQNLQILDRMAALGFDYVLASTADGVRVTFSKQAVAGEAVAAGSDRRLAVVRGALAALT